MGKRRSKTVSLLMILAPMLSACDLDIFGWNKKEHDDYFDCKISFLRENDGSSGELSDSESKESVLPINEDIKIHVDFTFQNWDSVNDVIDFQVNLKPGFDTYQVFDYTAGPQEPTIPAHEEDLMDVGGTKKIIGIRGMKFNIKSDNAKKGYKYEFTLKAKNPSKDCEFKAIFSPQDGNFNGGRNKSFAKKFILSDRGEAND